MTQCSQCTVFDAPNACEETFLPTTHPSRARTDADAYTQAARTLYIGAHNRTCDNDSRSADRHTIIQNQLSHRPNR